MIAHVGATRGRGGLGALLGAVLGVVLGVVIDGAIWLWLLATALSSGESPSAGPLAHVSGNGGSVTVTGGAGLLLIPLAIGALGAGAGYLLARGARTSGPQDARQA